MEMLAQTHDIKTVICHSPLEAALLEGDEIKQHKPIYNIMLNNNDKVLHFYNRHYTDVALRQNENYPHGPFRQNNALECLRQIYEKFKIADFRILNFGDLSLIEIEEGYKQFCTEFNVNLYFFQKHTFRDCIYLALKIFKDYKRKHINIDFEREWRKSKNILNL